MPLTISTGAAPFLSRCYRPRRRHLLPLVHLRTFLHALWARPLVRAAVQKLIRDDPFLRQAASLVVVDEVAEATAEQV